MIEELSLIRGELIALETTIEAIRKRRTSKRLSKYAYSILTIKENLIKLEHKLRRLPATTPEDKEEKTETKETIDTMIFTIRERENAVDRTETDVLIEDFKTLRSAFAEVSGSLPVEQIMFLADLSNIPQDIREETRLDLEEIRKCYNAEVYRSAVGMCGQVLEVLLARKYFEVKGLDPIERKWTLGRLIGRCIGDGIISEPGLENICNLINSLRISSVHSTCRAYKPQQDDTKPVIEFTLGLVKKLFP